MQIESPTFDLLKTRECDYIKIAESEVRVTVFRFYPESTLAFESDEIVYYAKISDQYLAFVVYRYFNMSKQEDDYILNENDIKLASLAIMWYAREIQYPELDITLIDPRPKNTMRLVN
jgi:hypothetical protein